MGVFSHPTLANINLKSILLLGTTPLRIGSLDVKGAEEEEGTWELSPRKEVSAGGCSPGWRGRGLAVWR